MIILQRFKLWANKNSFMDNYIFIQIEQNYTPNQSKLTIPAPEVSYENFFKQISKIYWLPYFSNLNFPKDKEYKDALQIPSAGHQKTGKKHHRRYVE